MPSFNVLNSGAATETETQSDGPPARAPSLQANRKRLMLVGAVISAALLAAGAAVATKPRTTAQWKKRVVMSKTGCADWSNQTIGDLQHLASQEECTAKCDASSDCKYSNYQSGGCNVGAGGQAGSCYLFRGCEKMEKNPCWDLTKSSKFDPAPAPAENSGPAQDLSSVLDLVRGIGFESINLNRCALVGSSSVMNGKRAGQQIDAYDTVIRLNRIPPSEFWGDFGKKTDVLFINHFFADSEVVDVMRHGWTEKKSCRELDNCKGAGIVMRSDSGGPCNVATLAGVWGYDHSMVACLRSNISDVAYSLTGVRLSTVYGSAEPSSGFLAFLAFLPLCKELDLFGFGGTATADGHGEWAGHPLREEHFIQDLILNREFGQLPWSEHSVVGQWILAHAATVRKGKFR